MKRIVIMMACVVCSVQWPAAIQARTDVFCQNVTSAAQAPYIPTSGTFRCLIVFVQFQDDDFDNSCTEDSETGWPHDLLTIPSWATGNKLIHSSVTANYTEGSLSHFYDVMSGGTFDFIGDVHPDLYLTPEPIAYYSHRPAACGKAKNH